ncbi:hypoxic response protein 1 [Microbulbifer aestuariivivens]|uniref:Hypoxic response protein 1 n=1 Tax=Microbulbifer aestuariivivens TaxID=1908308 RepID=A0ABP9WNY9_9GAMM
MRVGEAMHQGCTWVGPDTPLSEVAQILREEDIGSVPVGENDRLVGMVTDRDIAVRGVANGGLHSKAIASSPPVGELTARDVMTEGVEWLWEDDDMDTALGRMEQYQLRRMPVINSERRLVGILSMGDITHALNRDRCGEFASAVSAHH